MFALFMAVHVLGIVLWIGGAAAAAKVLLARAQGGSSDALLPLERAFLFKACHPGMLLTILSGLCLLALNSGYFLKEGWFYGKLLFAAGAIAVTILLTAASRKLSASTSAITPGVLKLYEKLLWASVVALFLLVFLKPF